MKIDSDLIRICEFRHDRGGCVLLALYVGCTQGPCSKPPLVAEQILSSVASGQQCEQSAKIDPQEAHEAFRAIRLDMYRITFACYAGGDKEAIQRLNGGLKLAEECEAKIAPKTP